MKKEIEELHAKLNEFALNDSKLDPKLLDIIIAQLEILKLLKAHDANLTNLKEEFMKPLIILPGENDKTGKKIKLSSKKPSRKGKKSWEL